MTTDWRAIMIAGCLLCACGKNPAPATDAGKITSSPAPSKQITIASIFPPGPGRDMVLSTCGSCHPVVCTARGQRTAERWDSLKKDHLDKLTRHSAAEVDTMFAYLKANFNDTKPEPQIPAELLQQGCTPF